MLLNLVMETLEKFIKIQIILQRLENTRKIAILFPAFLSQRRHITVECYAEFYCLDKVVNFHNGAIEKPENLLYRICKSPHDEVGL